MKSQLRFPAFALLALAGMGVAFTRSPKPIPATGAGVSSSCPRLPLLAPNALSSEQAEQRLKEDRDPFWLAAQREVNQKVIRLAVHDQREQQRDFSYSRLKSGTRLRKQIALTFDDGPHPAFTPEILRILDQQRVNATFFLVGQMAEKYPELVREQVMRGNEIGNHTYHHVSLVKIPEEDVAVELKACGDVLRHTTGRSPHLFRPPGGEYDRAVAEMSNTLGYTMVLWTDDPGDYEQPGADVILQRTLKRARNGGILLLHDGIRQTIDILPRLIETLKREGFEFVTVDRMIAENAKSKKRKYA